MHTVEDLENTLKDIFITTESTYNQQVELENLLEEVDPRSLIRTIWENSETIYSFRTEKKQRAVHGVLRIRAFQEVGNASIF